MADSLTVTAAEANRSFSKLLRAAREGSRIIITSHGKPVAEMGPASGDEEERKRRLDALAELEAHWASLEPRIVGPWSREELYDRD